jgi:hypothetical protein
MRPGAGRKPKPTKERLRNRVMFTLADDEFEALDRARREEPMSSFMRRLVLRYLARRKK